MKDMEAALNIKIGQPLRRLYHWTIQWAAKPQAEIALFILAFTESSFFPIPPDVLLIAMAVAKPTKAWRYAFICTVGSVLGGIFGWVIGYFFFSTVGQWIVNFFSFQEQFKLVEQYYQINAWWYILAAAFTPIPYKVFTIASGLFNVSLWTLVMASVIGRAGRFFLVSGLIYKFGSAIKNFIDKYFNLLTWLFLILLILGFYLVKYF